ncbi:hypothetical protein [Sediminibacterium ginsengisoli]|uniref:Uncharacterized protein n=1 Tax=Sediminibacterium ginsengisoli TaxID=413434 RepID=A0A1T4P3F2_9BACT|nr:hypothetical protein [Sediminibacterium ginsengisoli]SJZ85989.1 hypothetical protein SAMN04488132_105125 [Sediminibacterium ginsengisoli]
MQGRSLHAQQLTGGTSPAGVADSASHTGLHLTSVTKNYDQLSSGLDRAAERALSRFEKLEQKLKRKLARRDSTAAKKLFAGSEQQYRQLEQKLKGSDSLSSVPNLNTYLPGLDSLKTSLRFLDQPGTTLKNITGGELSKATAAVSLAGKNLQDAVQVQHFLKERRQQLKEQLEQLGLVKDLKKLNKEVYYYQQQLNEYKDLLNHPDKLAQQVVSRLRDLPAFKDFMSRNSELSQLFRAPGNANIPGSLAGLQTRTSVQQQLSQQIGNNANPQQYLQQQMQQAQGELNKLKDKVNQLGGGSSDMEIPDFKPNNQKTKSFWKRLEYGVNIQSQKPNGLMPVTSDLALTAGYKLNDKSTIGIGASYKMGWGKDISHIRISSQGLGLRSYVDVKLKGSIWISGGYEYNYQQEFSRLDQLRDLNAWQKSGLIGLSKKYKLGKKNGNLQLLWDFLSYSQVPKTQPLKFRVGYVF